MASQLYIGTAYHQVYEVPLSLKDPIKKYGEKKRCPVVSIYLAQSQQNQEHEQSSDILNNYLSYVDSSEYFQINKQSNEIIHSEKFGPLFQTKQKQLNNKLMAEEKIIQFEYVQADDKAVYYTNHGNVYSKNRQEQYLWQRVFLNESYLNLIKSLPPQRAGKQPPEYLKSLLNTKSAYMQVGFVGRGVLPFVYEAQQKATTWQAKNVTNDYLDLQVPQNDVDLCFINHGYHLVTAHAQNKIRIYDVNSRRRKPISDVQLTQITKNQKATITKLQKSECQKYIYVGNHRGSIYELDTRKNLSVCAKIKGITTSIKDMKVSGEFMSVISLDGYLRLFNIKNKQKVYQRYLNTHPTVIKLGGNSIKFKQQQIFKIQQIKLNTNKKNNKNKGDDQEVDLDEEEEKKPQKVKKIRKRNKVGLKYLQGTSLDKDVKIQQKIQDQNNQNKIQCQYQDQDLSL